MKNLPIVVFEYRDKDSLEIEGRGSSVKRKWVLGKRALKEHSFALSNKLSDLIYRFENREKHHSNLPIVVKAEIIDDAIAKSYRGKISSLLSIEGSNVIGFNNRNELLIKVRDITELQQILKHFEHPENYEVSISALNDLLPYEPTVSYSDIKNDDYNFAKVKLFNYYDKFLNFEVRNAFDVFCRENEIRTKRIDQYGEDLFIYAIEDVSEPTLDSLKKFDGIFEVSNMPLYEPEKSDSEFKKNIPIKTPDPNKDYPTVAILDSGISHNQYMKPWLIDERKISHYKDEEINPTHGTSVASVLLYGHELEGKPNENGSCRIIDATVFPDLNKRKIPEHELIVQIENTIANNKDIEYWNLSLGTKKEVDFNRFSDFGVALDNLQSKYNILICKSVGNCDNYKQNIQNGKVSQSSDSVLSLVVGSLAHDKSEIDLAEVNYPSPFTRFGPAPANVIKPDLVEYGGNVGMKNGEFVNNGVTTIAPNGNLTKNTGTSFSTPRVTSLAASLGHNIDMDFDPLLVKALMIHNANHPKRIELDLESKIKQMGYGVPASIQDMLYNDVDEITLVLRDKLKKGKFVDITDFPYPRLIEDGIYYGKIIVTLVTKPILEASQGIEYCQSDLKIKFGSYDYLKKKDITDNRRVKIPYKKVNAQNFLLSSIYSKRKMKAHDDKFQKERILLDSFKKYQPVKKWVVNLDELTDGNSNKYLKAPKKWYLKIQPLFRDFIENKFPESKKIPTIDFCLLITISDPLKKGIVNTEIQQNLDKLGFDNDLIPLKFSGINGSKL